MTPRSRGTVAWLSLAATLGLGATALWFAPRAGLDWQPALALREPWRAFSAAFVHLTPWHLGANLLGCGVVAAYGAVARVPSRAAWAWLAAWPLTHLALGLQPNLAHYGGLSGVLHAGVAVATWYLVRHGAGRRRAIGAGVAIGLGAKLLLEKPWGPPTQSIAGWDFAVAPLAHASGAAAGLVCAWLADAAAKPRR